MRFVKGLCLTVLVAAAGLAAVRPTAHAAPADFVSQASLLRFISRYAPARDAAEIPQVVKAMGQFGVFHNPDSAGVYVGFLAGALAADPAHADRTIVAIAALPAEDHWAAVRAIAWSGLPDWRDRLRRHAARFPTRDVMIEKYLSGDMATLQQLTPGDGKPGFWRKLHGYLHREDAHNAQARARAQLNPTSDLIDALWGYYFASRRYQPVGRLIALLPWAKERDDTDRLMLGAMAKLTLATNAARDPALNALLKRARGHVGAQAAAELDEVIVAADTVNTGAIRAAALGAIEEIKRKGSATSREMAWYSRLGESAIALGCIGAAAAGQVQLGIPCVVGGALSSAVAKNIGAGG